MSDESNPYDRPHNQFDKAKSNLKERYPDYEKLLDYTTHISIQLHEEKHIFQEFKKAQFARRVLIADKNKEGLKELDERSKHDPIYREFMKQEGHKNLINHVFPNSKRHKNNHYYKVLVTTEWGKNISQFPSAEKAGNFYVDWLRDQYNKEYEPRTVAGWIRDYAKASNIKFR